MEDRGKRGDERTKEKWKEIVKGTYLALSFLQNQLF
jgi:hypothetical protein